MKNFCKSHIVLISLLAAIYSPVSGGVDFVFIEYITRYIDPINLSIVRMFLIALFFVIVHRMMVGPFRIKKKDIPRFLIGGGIGMGTYAVAEAIGISMTSAALSSLLLAGSATFVTIGDRIFNKTKISLRKIICIVTSLVGVFIVVMSVKENDISGSLTGIVVLIIATLLWSAYLLAVKPLHESYSNITVTTGVFVSAAIVDIPLFILYRPEAVLSLGPGHWGMVLIFTLICFALTQFLYLFGLKNLSVTTSAMVMNLMPFITIIISFVIFGRIPGIMQLIGGGIILTSVICVSFEKSQSDKNGIKET